MTMTEKIRVHAEIERENWEKTQDFIGMMYWESLSVNEVRKMIEERDREMQWDEQFGFLCDLLDSKIEKEVK